MKKSSLALIICYALLLFSFKTKHPCDYANSNISYVLDEIQTAYKTEKIEHSKFFIFKALNGLEKSKKQLADCNCTSSLKLISDTESLLKRAIKTEEIKEYKLIVDVALINIKSSLKEIAAHHLHTADTPKRLIAMNYISDEAPITNLNTNNTPLESKIDSLLKNYEESLQLVVTTVNCKEAKALAKKNYHKSEKELLRQDLTEAKRYFHYRTKEITKTALDQIGECSN